MSALARIVIDDGVAYVVWTEGRTVPARLTGRMLRDVRSGAALRPVVGDWVHVRADGTIEGVEPRRSRLARKAPGSDEDEQVLVANVDLAFVATAPGRDLNERRLERYLTVAREGRVEPVVLLTKADTCPDLDAELARIRSVAPRVDILAVSTVTGIGVSSVADRLAPDRTAAIVGSSGVGKSTLANALLGHDRQSVGGLTREGKGRHTTTRRELLAVPTGGFLVDMPGLRELGVLRDDGLAEAFADVTALAEGCRFQPCMHEHEQGCAVRAALHEGSLDEARFASFLKLHEEARPRRTRATRR